MKKKSGFTILELVIVIAFASLALVLFFLQKANVDAMNRDKDRKTGEDHQPGSLLHVGSALAQHEAPLR